MAVHIGDIITFYRNELMYDTGQPILSFTETKEYSSLSV